MVGKLLFKINNLFFTKISKNVKKGTVERTYFQNTTHYPDTERRPIIWLKKRWLFCFLAISKDRNFKCS